MRQCISKLFSWAKDGGEKSNVDGFFLIESKPLFSIVLLRFNQGCREEFHTHAFNAFTWFLSGDMVEEDFDGSFRQYFRSLIPKYTPRSKNHRVYANKTSWALSLRGRWLDQWTEHNRRSSQVVIMTHGRKIVGVKQYE